jgi:hypothetical protein
LAEGEDDGEEVVVDEEREEKYSREDSSSGRKRMRAMREPVRVVPAGGSAPLSCKGRRDEETKKVKEGRNRTVVQRNPISSHILA